ncbi:MAG: hypothetical protein WC907_06675 [Acholeplasmataceae bacterium]|jgi:hypothetical protein
MTEEVKELGKIINTTLGFEHGVLTFVLMFDFGGSVQGFGGYGLDGTADTVIKSILRAVGVNYWEQLEGKSCWAYFDKKYGKITAIEAPDFVEHKGRFDLNNETCARGYHISEISYEICQACQEHTNKNCFVKQQADSIRKLRGIS